MTRLTAHLQTHTDTISNSDIPLSHSKASEEKTLSLNKGGRLVRGKVIVVSEGSE